MRRSRTVEPRASIKNGKALYYYYTSINECFQFTLGGGSDTVARMLADMAMHSLSQLPDGICCLLIRAVAPYAGSEPAGCGRRRADCVASAPWQPESVPADLSCLATLSRGNSSAEDCVAACAAVWLQNFAVAWQRWLWRAHARA